MADSKGGAFGGVWGNASTVQMITESRVRASGGVWDNAPTVRTIKIRTQSPVQNLSL